VVDNTDIRARLNVIIRRRQARNVEAATLRAKSVVMDRLARIVTVGDTVIDLLPIEFKLLELLLLHVDQVLTRAMLLQKVWGFKFDPQTNIVESHISRLRSKMDAADVITTVRGAGYLVSSG
jgi:two-component system OmpR family response regulator